MKNFFLTLLLISSTAAFAQVEPDNPYTDCAVVEKDMNQPAYLDWQNIRGIQELEVCLFSIVTTLEGNQSISQFLRASGFRSVLIIDYDINIMRSFGSDVAGYLFSTGIAIEELPDNFGGWFGFETWGAYGLSVGLIVDERGRLLSVSATYTRK